MSAGYFNSRPSARGDPAQRRRKVEFFYFNSRPSARGDVLSSPCFFSEKNFNSRPSARGDMSSGAHAPRRRPFQFTPLREGRRWEFHKAMGRVEISIHAPPRGATRVVPLVRDVILISIHAPPRGATDPNQEGLRARKDFNSRPSARGDREERKMKMKIAISIHAPPRGATRFFQADNKCPWRFQFTPLREGRQQKICNFCKSFVQPLQISMA